MVVKTIWTSWSDWYFSNASFACSSVRPLRTVSRQQPARQKCGLAAAAHAIDTHFAPRCFSKILFTTESGLVGTNSAMYLQRESAEEGGSSGEVFQGSLEGTSLTLPFGDRTSTRTARRRPLNRLSRRPSNGNGWGQHVDASKRRAVRQSISRWAHLVPHAGLRLNHDFASFITDFLVC